MKCGVGYLIMLRVSLLEYTNLSNVVLFAMYSSICRNLNVKLNWWDDFKVKTFLILSCKVVSINYFCYSEIFFL